MENLALLGGPRAVREISDELFTWPIVTPEMEEAVLSVLRSGTISGLQITMEFEREFADWLGVKCALAHNTGTAAIHGALYGLGVGAGDEVICPSMTYWASCVPVFSLGGTVVLADIDPLTLCIDPADLEKRISERTKAVVVVHYAGMPADMDSILDIARRHDIRVLEDASHSHGSLYKGRVTGTMGEAAGFSLMSAKSFPIGEGGMLVTNEREIFERAVAFGHYARHGEYLTIPEISAGAGVPWGGYKYRLNQLCSAIGKVQLKLYPEQMAEIDRAMNHFWDLLEDVPGIRPRRPEQGSGTTMGGWYNPLGYYDPEKLGGLSITRFCQAVRAEGFDECAPGCNRALHTHPIFQSLDVYGNGKPTIVANARPGIDVRLNRESLPVSDTVQSRAFKIPWLKRYIPEGIERFALAFKKVADNFEQLIPDDPGNPANMGNWGTSSLVHP
jgi:dTDP-4-amino-4,6-dideoxygalactose transaminase